MKKVLFVKLTKKAMIVSEVMERTLLGDTSTRSTGRLGLLQLTDKQYKAAQKMKKGEVIDVTIGDRNVVDKDGAVMSNMFWAY